MNLSDATVSYTAYSGFLNDLTAAPTYGCYFRYTHGTNGGRWESVTHNGGANTEVKDTGVTAAISDMTKFEVRVNAAGTSVDFLIDGAVVTTHTNHIPGAGINLGVGSSFIKISGSAALNVALTDYWMIKQNFTGR